MVGTTRPGAGELVSSVVRVYMAARGETQAELAAVLGVSRPAVSQKLSGRYPWSLADLELLAAHYKTTPAALVSGEALELLEAGRRRHGRRAGGLRALPA